MKYAVLVGLALANMLAGCGGKRRADLVPTGAVMPAEGATEIGLASWYGHPYHGQASASGEIYDMEKLTAAHRTLPFGTRVEIQNLENSKTVEVRINDRGPFSGNRIVDLSHAAARAIGMLGPGTAKVSLNVLSLPEESFPGHFAVQVGAFRERDNAERLRGEMKRKYGSARMVLREGSPAVWRVLVGFEPTKNAADALARQIRKQASDKSAAFVVRVDSV